MLVTCATLGVIVGALLGAMGRSKAQEMAQAVDLPDVEVGQVAQQDVPISSEWMGTLDGMVKCYDQGAGDGLPAQAALRGRRFCHAGPGVV